MPTPSPSPDFVLCWRGSEVNGLPKCPSPITQLPVHVAPSPTSVATAVPFPLPGQTWPPTPKIITLKCDDTCTAAERAKVTAIEAAMNRTLGSACFAQYFMTPGRRFDNTKLPPAQILSKLGEPTTLTLNYYYRKFRPWPRLAPDDGYESADDFSVIHFNRAHTASWPVCDKASLGGHEFSHAKDFWHIGNKRPPNVFTVPYQVNAAFDACCKEAA